MAKYSTGNNISNSNEKDSCAVCGSQEDLQLAEIGERKIKTCIDCRQDSDKISLPDTQTVDRQKNKVGGYTITNPDSSWVEEDRPDYGNKTPYLIADYDDIVENAVVQLESSKSDICEDIGIDKKDLNSLINGDAFSDSVGMDLITKVEEYLDISIREDLND